VTAIEAHHFALIACAIYHAAGEDLPSVLPDWLAAHHPPLTPPVAGQVWHTAQSWARMPTHQKDAIAAQFTAVAKHTGD